MLMNSSWALGPSVMHHAWREQGCSCVAFSNGAGSIRTLCLAPDAGTLYVGSVTPGVKVWDVSAAAAPAQMLGSDVVDSPRPGRNAFQAAIQAYKDVCCQDTQAQRCQQNVIQGAEPTVVSM